MKQLAILLFATILIVGCNKVEQEGIEGITVPVSLSIKSLDGVSIPVGGVKSVSLYICDQGKIIWISRLKTENSSNVGVPVERLGQGMMYCIVNEDVCVGAKDLVVGDLETNIKSLYSSYVAGAGVDGRIAMCGSTDLTGLNHGSSISVSLKRNMARFDIVLQHADITPKSITVEGLPLKGTLFAEDGVVSTDTYDLTEALTYTANSGIVQGAFYVHEFEQKEGVKPHVEITLLYGDVEIKSYVDISKAERNKVYKIILREIDGELTGTIMMEGDMEFGDDSTVNPDENGSSIFINPTLSTLSDKIVLGSDNRRLMFPSKGGEAIIALTGEEIQYIEEGSLSEDLTIEKQADGRYKIKVKANRTINPSHEAALLKFIPKAETNQERFVRISVVMESYAPFEVVTMADVDWMIVNAQGKNVGAYPILKNGTTAQNLFSSSWNKWSGTGEQWGPRPGKNGVVQRFPPWLDLLYNGNIPYTELPNINGAIIGGDKLTQWDNHAYCPDGWRVPTREEFAAIWPTAGTILNEATPSVSYTTIAGNFTAKFQKLGNNCIVISDGKNELVFPLVGFREHNGIHNPGNTYDYNGRDISSNVYYWCYDRPVGGNAYVFGYEKNTIQNGGAARYSITNMAFNSAAWLNSRCVRKAKNLE